MENKSTVPTQAPPANGHPQDNRTAIFGPGNRRRFFTLFALSGAIALSGCAQMANVSSSAPAASGDAIDKAQLVYSFHLPPDALGARDPQLTSVLRKAGALAAAQKQPTVILVTALGQDFRYLNQAIWNGVPTRQAGNVRLENMTAGPTDTYSVSIRLADSRSGS